VRNRPVAPALPHDRATSPRDDMHVVASSLDAKSLAARIIAGCGPEKAGATACCLGLRRQIRSTAGLITTIWKTGRIVGRGLQRADCDSGNEASQHGAEKTDQDGQESGHGLMWH
jgi:hypothetical protein